MAAMNSDELRFHKLMNVMADQCNFPLNEFTIEIYDKCLAEYGYARVCVAMMDIFKTRRGSDRFPSVADILEKMGVVVSDRSMAVDCANMIMATFNKWRMDYTGREDFERLFRELVGDLPWTVVERMGGYRALYREWNECKDLSSFRAQIRDAAQSAIELIRAGRIDDQPLLAESNVKQIEGKNEK